MHPSRLLPASPHVSRSSPSRHAKRFGSLSVPEEHRDAALKSGEAQLPAGRGALSATWFSAFFSPPLPPLPSSPCPGGEQAKEGAVPMLSRAVSMPGDISSEGLYLGGGATAACRCWAVGGGGGPQQHTHPTV